MDRSTIVRTTVAATVAGLGLTVGGIAVATAADDPTEQPDRRDHGSLEIAPFGHRFGPDPLAEQLAEELDLQQKDVEDALDAVRDDLRADLPRPRSDEWPEPPTEEELEEHRDAFVTALAKALGVSEEEVNEALDAIREEAESRTEDLHEELRARARQELVDRLDEAVEGGTLTEADKESVLEAYDEGVLVGFGHRVPPWPGADEERAPGTSA
jgi:hypothetical protein